jgi:hypothetical protein
MVWNSVMKSFLADWYSSSSLSVSSSSCRYLASLVEEEL